MRNLFFWSTIVTLIAACSDVPTFPEKVNLISVHCVLNHKFKTQVFVNHAINVDDLDGVYNRDSLKTRISGAHVIIEGNGQQIVLTEKRPGLYEDIYSELRISEGQKYSLSVEVDDEKVYAETTVPITPQLTEPVNMDSLIVFLEVDTDYTEVYSTIDSRVTNSAIKYSWKKTVNASYQFSIVNLEISVMDSDSVIYYYPDLYTLTGSILENALNIFGNNSGYGKNWIWSSSYPEIVGVTETRPDRIEILVYDEASTNYFNYDYHGLERTSNIVGGLGCFGSINYYSKDITLIVHSQYAEW